MSTRYHEKNCNSQCVKCNTYDEGNNVGYTFGLIKKYGESVISELYVLKHQTSKLSDFELEQLIIYYTKKVKQLREEKGL